MAIRNRVFRVKPNHGCELPGQVIALGYSGRRSEDGGSITLAQWVGMASQLKDGRWTAPKCSTGESAHECWRWVYSRMQPKQSTYVVTWGWHDATVLLGLWKELDRGGMSLGLPDRIVSDGRGDSRTIPAWRGMVAIEDKPFVLFGVCSRGVAKIVDVRNYWEMSLDEFTASFSGWVSEPITHLAAPSDFQGNASLMALSVYAATVRTMSQWREGDRGNWQPTAGRLAMGNWRHEFMADHEFRINNILMDREFHRESYFGGEFSTWYRGFINGPLWKVDCTGLYPAVMQNGCFPYDIDQHMPQGTKQGRMPPDRPGNCIGRVLVHGMGDMPCRREDGRVIFPTGIFWTALAGCELGIAADEGRVKEWDGWTSFKVAPIFSRYVAYWWAVRKQAKDTGDAATDSLAKMMLNSLYGKFAALSAQWVVTDKMPADRRWGTWLGRSTDGERWTKYRAIAGVVQEQRKRAEKEDTFPAIAAFVTAAGRSYMRAVRSMLPERSCVSQQTDSLLLTEAGYEALRETVYWQPGALGCFRDVNQYWWANVIDANHVVWDGGETLAGIPLKRRRTADNRWEAELVDTTANRIAGGILADSISIKKGEFILNGVSDGKSYGPDGWAFM